MKSAPPGPDPIPATAAGLRPETLTALAAAAAVLIAGLLPTPWPALALAPAVYLFTRRALRALARRVSQAEQVQCLLDSQLIQSQKLAAIGQMSSGIAHEINNPLAIIGQEVELLRLNLGAEGACPTAGELAEIRDSLREIARQVDRCGQITHKLLDFARKREPIFQEEAAGAVIEDMVNLVEREAKVKGVAIRREYDPSGPRIATDVPLLRQVVLNLLTNAYQATPPGGTITVGAGADPRGGTRIVVADTGPGIAPENLDKVFDPFFTTKPPGQGTGLGLSLSHGIVEKLGGSISVASEPGRGATFTVRLPDRPPGRPGA